MYGVDGRDLSRQYKHHISDYHSWEQLHHAHDYVLYKQNLGERLSMDETCLSQGELYTIVTNKVSMCANFFLLLFGNWKIVSIFAGV